MNYTEYLTKRKPYQERGYLFLLERKHACLFYQPGKGKTYPCIDAIRDIDSRLKGNARVLILSTADAIKNMWLEEIEPQKILPKNTIMLSFTSAIQDARKVQLLKVKWDIIVIDECHKIKAHNTKISKLVYQLSKKAEYTFGLTGTPRGNNDIDVYCQFHNMNISSWGEINYTTFVEKCCDFEPQFFGGNFIKKPIGVKDFYRAGWERNVAMYSQRVDYEDVDDMPELVVNEIPFVYDITKEYLSAQDGVIQIPDYETTMTKLAAISKLHQIVNGFMYYTYGNDEDHRLIYDISGQYLQNNKKLKWIKNNLSNDPWTIVYKFEADRKALQYMLDELKIKYTEDVNDFKKGKAKILLLQCSRCESFNLQICNRITFYTFDYSFINYKQMLHRVWRMGQEKDVTIDVLYYNDTVESKIWKAVKNKQSLADLFMSIKGV